MLKNRVIFILIILLFSSCATFNTQVNSEINQTIESKNKTLAHQFYLIGDAGNADIGTTTLPLISLDNALQNAPKKSTVLFLGDNIYDKGLPKKKDKNYALALHRIQTQIDAVKDHKIRPIFIPGNHDYYSNGIKGLQRQEKIVKKALGKNAFLPKNSCPITSLNISDKIALIIIDSQWYLENWDDNPTMNNLCEIKTREDFFIEFESLIKKNRGKTTLIALHHPVVTDGSHGGKFSLKQHISPSNGFPIPILGSIANFIRKTGGVSVQDVQNKTYRTLINRLTTISQNSERVVFIGGHEHSMQYLETDAVKQIVSGSGCKTSGVNRSKHSQFSDPNLGYAILQIYTDGTTNVKFVNTTPEGDNTKFQKQIFPAYPKENLINTNDYLNSYFTAVYDTNASEKSGFYKFSWGDHYRDEYNTAIQVDAINLDTLFGGVIPIKRGGGNQSVSLRLEDKTGKQWVMRALKKNAVQFLQITAYKERYMTEDLKGTFLETFIEDVYTTANPYSAFIMPTLSKAVGVYHSNPKLYYIPKQKALGRYNNDYGDELYMIEEHVGKTQNENPSFGNSEKIISTLDLFKKLDATSKNTIDEKLFVRSRLFDMILGDWDRHQDQWRWAKFDEKGKTVYKPIPRDRDQVFSNYDGFMFGLLRFFTPSIKKMQTYENEISSIRWHNTNGSKVDNALIKTMELKDWLKEATYIKDHLTDQVIDQAFAEFPKEVLNEKLEKVKSVLKYRRDHIHDIANEYYEVLNNHVVLKASNKKDKIEILRLPEGKTQITFSKKSKIYFQKTYDKNITKEIWLYALDGEDKITVKGKSNKYIDIKIIGGQKTDTYIVENGRKIDVIDYKSKNNNVEQAKKANLVLVDDYDMNTYNYSKKKDKVASTTPIIGRNPDDGLFGGINYRIKINKFRTNPFSQRHLIKFTGYETRGFDAYYEGEYGNLFNQLNILFNFRYTSPNYANNFFGFGNETNNLDDSLGLNYNRVKLAVIKSEIGIVNHGREGSLLNVKFTAEKNKVDNSENRFISSTALGLPSTFYESKIFIGTSIDYSFKNYNDPIFPTLGFKFSGEFGVKSRVSDFKKTFAHLSPSITFIHSVFTKRLVLANKTSTQFIFGQDYEFYQAASIGGNNGLRGFRFERFTGKSAFTNSSDLRLNFRKMRSGIAPMNMGIFAGFDIGKVWFNNEESNKWHNSYGGGFWLNFAELMSAQIGVFNSVEDLRITFKVGYDL